MIISKLLAVLVSVSLVLTAAPATAMAAELVTSNDVSSSVSTTESIAPTLVQEKTGTLTPSALAAVKKTTKCGQTGRWVLYAKYRASGYIDSIENWGRKSEGKAVWCAVVHTQKKRSKDVIRIRVTKPGKNIDNRSSGRSVNATFKLAPGKCAHVYVDYYYRSTYGKKVTVQVSGYSVCALTLTV